MILNFADDPIWPSLPALLAIVGRHIFDAEIGVDDAVLVGPGGLVPEDGPIRRDQLHVLVGVVRLAHFSSEPVPIRFLFGIGISPVFAYLDMDSVARGSAAVKQRLISSSVSRWA